MSRKISLFLIVTSCFSVATIAQPINLKGYVHNVQGVPIPFAHISSIDQQTGTISDMKGYFELFYDSLAEIRVSHVGFETKTITQPINVDTIVILLEEEVINPIEFNDTILDLPSLMNEIFRSTYKSGALPNQTIFYQEINWHDSALAVLSQKKFKLDLDSVGFNLVLLDSLWKQYPNCDDFWANINLFSSEQDAVKQSAITQTPSFFDYSSYTYELIGFSSDEGYISYNSRDEYGTIVFDKLSSQLLSYTITSKKPEKFLTFGVKSMARLFAKMKLELRELYQYEEIRYSPEGQLSIDLSYQRLMFEGSNKHKTSNNTFYRIMYGNGISNLTDKTNMNFDYIPVQDNLRLFEIQLGAVN